MLSEGVPSKLLTAVLHPCLAKQPAWPVRNSRPVMLEPYLRCLEISMARKQRMSRTERWELYGVPACCTARDVRTPPLVVGPNVRREGTQMTPRVT